MNKKSIVLIGFMGAGKTTLGKELAKKLQRGFIDIDSEIEKVYQMQTVDIFKTYGEEKFRQTEKELIIEASKQEDKVISIGGGAFKQKAIREACMDNAIVLFIHISWEHWIERIDLLIDSRPLLQNKSLSEIKVLFDERQAIYQPHHLQVTIDDLGVQEAIEHIADNLKKVQ